MTKNQQELVELTLLELSQGSNMAHFKHDVWRFSKRFLCDHFKSVVYSVYRSIYRSPAQEISMAISREQLQEATVKVVRPGFS
ncbi:hypothetical protein [Pseudomonas asplenii]|uniref:hypothetical protein n=1 Tax=Pseudomonas asplenii TaxID=53407 RepID=UPI00128ED138|nr:hypothetical protein [Pseudomonas fuscovaginae]